MTQVISISANMKGFIVLVVSVSTQSESWSKASAPIMKHRPSRLKNPIIFFKMSRYQDWLIDHIHNHPDFITPKRYKNEVLSFL